MSEVILYCLLFILVVDVLSRLMIKVDEVGLIEGLEICRNKVRKPNCNSTCNSLMTPSSMLKGMRESFQTL